MKHFFLTTDPWLPVTENRGKKRQVSLVTLFEEGEKITDLYLPPGLRIAVMRLLLAIVSRALPLPENRGEWRQKKADIAPRVLCYLQKWHDAFDLYGETPFLQAKGLETTDNATVDKLDFSLASGNNHTLFDHGAAPEGRLHTPDEQALLLLLMQNFNPGGLIGPNSWNGVKTNEKSGNRATPALEGSPLHIFLLGENILETLWLNLIPVNELDSIEIGIPPWEDPPKNAAEAQRFRNTLLGRLAPISRAIILPEEGNLTAVAVGCNYAQINEFIDPYLANVRHGKDQTLAYCRVSPSRLFWRDLEGLLWLQAESGKVTRPKNVFSIKELPPEQKLTFWAGGVAVDKAKYKFVGEWRFRFQISVCSSSIFWQYFTKFVRDAESIEQVVVDGINLFWKNLCEVTGSRDDQKVSVNAGKESAADFAKNEFWHQVDRLAFEWLNRDQAVADPELFQQQENKLFELAHKIFDDAVPQTSARHLLAYGKTHAFFSKKLNNLKQTEEKKGDSEQ